MLRIRLSVARITAVAGGATLAACFASFSVAAAQTGLPRTYAAQRVDSPQPENSGLFSLALNLAGDLNGDGEQDLISPQVAGFNTQGRVFAFSGETGALIDTINAPETGGAGANAQFGLLGTAKVGVNRASAPFSDLGSCPGGSSGQTCGADPIGQPDGVPDLLIGATGIDVGGVTDVGRVYVIDGRTRAVLKRIDMPAADRALTAGPAGFGREVLAPEGLPGCEGNAGIGPCESMPAAVQIGDMDGGGRPDVVIGARRVNETPATASPGSHCARAAPTATCRGAGRTYIYRGEDIVGTSPAAILDGSGPGQVVRTLRNPDAQADDPLSAINTDGEGFGNDLIPIGDVGRCNNTGLAPGEICPRAASSASPDGRPEVVIPAPGADYPLANPDPAFSEVGTAYLVDGATGTVLQTYLHPEPQRGAAFGGNFEHTLASGDMGDTGLPDVSLGAPGQNATFTAAGRAYVMSGNFKASSGLTNVARLDDPTPDVTEENFGGSSAGVGDVVPGAEAPRNELIVGQSGPRVGPFVNTSRPLDVTFFNPSTERALQIVPDPDAQTSSAFGDSIEPLGDLNEDGFLDFAVGAFRYVGGDGTPAGRFYIFRSDNSPAPVPPAGGGPPVSGGPAAGGPAAGTTGPPAAAATAAAAAGRVIELAASRSIVPRGAAVVLRGTVEAFANAAACQDAQPIELQFRASGALNYETVAQARSDAAGSFTTTVRPLSSGRYRARVAQTAVCLGAASDGEVIAVPPAVDVVTRTARLGANRGFAFQLRCPAGSVCSGSVKLRTAGAVGRGEARRRITLGTEAFQIPSGRRRTTRVTVTPATARALRTTRSVPVDVFITSRDRDGRAISSRDRFTLRTR